MKKLLLIIVLLVVVTTKLMAQEVIKINRNAENQFKIEAKEKMDINLNFRLDQKDEYKVLVLDNQKNTVLSKKRLKEGLNKISFTMDEGEQYLVKFISITPIKLVVTAFNEN
ncbi:hypothetical protein [Flavobacterium faecale]|uniref:hypothetical protein n=1 Tax=Flavobacterium faecale TaxID=1355330 RepID=UPI003AAD3C3D